MKTYIEQLNEKDHEAILKGCKYHHSAWARGYVSRKLTFGLINKYKGKFGEGFTVDKPSDGKTRYHVIEYWIKEN